MAPRKKKQNRKKARLEFKKVLGKLKKSWLVKKLAGKKDLARRFFLLALVIGLWGGLPFSLEKNRSARREFLKNPLKIEANLELAKDYLTKNQFEEAEKRLLFLKEMGKDEGNWRDLWEEKEAKDPKMLEEEIRAWEKVVENLPELSYGYSQLGFLSLRLGREEEARGFWEKAKKLTPNQEEVIILGSLLEKE